MLPRHTIETTNFGSLGGAKESRVQHIAIAQGATLQQAITAHAQHIPLTFRSHGNPPVTTTAYVTRIEIDAGKRVVYLGASLVHYREDGTPSHGVFIWTPVE